MPVDFEQLSAKQLFELANKKLQQEQQEAQRAEMAARSAELRRRQQQILADHERALADLDRELLALKQRREQCIGEYQAQLLSMEQELAALEPSTRASPAILAAVRGTPELTLPPSAPVIAAELTLPTSAAPASTSRLTEDDLAAAIVEALRSRNDMSDSLLREKLRVRGYPLGNLGKVLEKMVREGAISSKGGGNYCIKKKV